MTKVQLAFLLARAMNLLNDIDREQFTAKQEGEFHSLARAMPGGTDYYNNGMVMERDLIKGQTHPGAVREGG